MFQGWKFKGQVSRVAAMMLVISLACLFLALEHVISKQIRKLVAYGKKGRLAIR